MKVRLDVLEFNGKPDSNAFIDWITNIDDFFNGTTCITRNMSTLLK